MENYWNNPQDTEEKKLRVPEDIADLGFRVECLGGLTVDHAYALYQAINQALPWFETEPDIALHTLHGAESGNGWLRPDKENELLYLSKRTRLRFRLSKSRFEDAKILEGQTLNIGNCIIKINKPTLRTLSTQTALFTRSLVSGSTQSENEFLHAATKMLNAKGIHPQRMMGGRQHTIQTPDKTLYARSLMIVDLSFDESIQLQRTGLGTEQKLGCGIFLPHKSIDAVYKPTAEAD